jgi:excisionase family DNA binding protein
MSIVPVPLGDDAPSDTSTSRLAYAPAEAANVVGVSRSFLYDEMSAGRLVSRHAGRRRLILAADLDAWLNSLPAS